MEVNSECFNAFVPVALASIFQPCNNLADVLLNVIKLVHFTYYSLHGEYTEAIDTII